MSEQPLGSARLVAFVPTRDFERSRAFYEGVLGLRVVSQDGFALVLDANGVAVRVSKVPTLQPAAFTVLGWEVPNIVEAVSGLRDRGVAFERFPMVEHDAIGIWTAPSGDRVAWFKDPDGNILSVTQHA